MGAMLSVKHFSSANGPYSEIKQVIRLEAQDGDLIQDFLDEGWSILEIEKSRMVVGQAFADKTTFILGGDEFAPIPDDYESRHAVSEEAQ